MRATTRSVVVSIVSASLVAWGGISMAGMWTASPGPLSLACDTATNVGGNQYTFGGGFPASPMPDGHRPPNEPSIPDGVGDVGADRLPVPFGVADLGTVSSPTSDPSESPSSVPSPTCSPTSGPSANPTVDPSAEPSGDPSAEPSGTPSEPEPSGTPTKPPEVKPPGLQ